LSAIGRTAARHLGRAGGSPAFGTLQAAGLAGVSSDFQVISRDCIAQSNAKELGFERHRAGCGVSIEKGRGKPGLWDATSGGPCGCFKWFFK